MKDFFDYLTCSNADRLWGLFLTVVGRYHAPANELYPSKKHPTGYYFEWETGRVLDEFQLNYISDGSGVLQTVEGDFSINAGTLILIRPGMKHRYKPDYETGWTENYIGFNGELSSHFINQTFGNSNVPVIQIGYQIEILDSFQQIIDLVKEQKPAYHQYASGLILKILGSISRCLKTRDIGNQELEELVNKAKAFMWEKVNENIDLQEFSKNHNISYSLFRKVFKMYTGFAPHQYYLDLKMMRAKELLVATDLSVKLITYHLGYDSVFYFSRLFKKKMGVSPTDLRKKQVGD
ncbi:AraC family transcriptional regulator [Reichenbachiella ulvae]|uniref:AraC family transcriptional regulator n=1 Tax=Reichenbachiella ulvae TaxID=2980104 RepID=A0ABT3CSZ9_9BACT|nr:AraC family transcriptional regulator [Reichenbachiella ulvae]MCV9386634.1 AraC family transcriptional regulator [Reichenbachiella ulvae]